MENRQSSATSTGVKFVLNRLSEKAIIAFRTRRLASSAFDHRTVAPASTERRTAVCRFRSDRRLRRALLRSLGGHFAFSVSRSRGTWLSEIRSRSQKTIQSETSVCGYVPLVPTADLAFSVVGRIKSVFVFFRRHVVRYSKRYYCVLFFNAKTFCRKKIISIKSSIFTGFQVGTSKN